MLIPGHLNQDELLAAYSDASILVGHLRGDPLHRWSQPSKIWEYMATGRPVVYAGEGEAIAIIEQHNLALTVPPEQPQMLAEAIRSLLEKPESASELGAQGKAFVLTHRRRSRLVEQFMELLSALTIAPKETSSREHS